MALVCPAPIQLAPPLHKYGAVPTPRGLSLYNAALAAANDDYPDIVTKVFAIWISGTDEKTTKPKRKQKREYILKAECPPIERPFFRCDPRFKTQHDLFEIQRGCSWGASEIEYKTDLKFFWLLDPASQELIQLLLAFFTRADDIVADNLLENFQQEVGINELKMWFGQQAVVEMIHAESYSEQFDVVTRCLSKERKKWLEDAYLNVPSIDRKIRWIKKWTHRDQPIGVRFLAFLATEGIFFAAAFALIFYYRKSGLIPGIMSANDFIARDERIHCEAATSIYIEHIVNKVPDRVIIEIFEEAAEIEMDFVRELAGSGEKAPLSEGLPHCVYNGGMTLAIIESHIGYVMRYWLNQLGVISAQEVGTSMVLWLERGVADSKVNFFEGRVTNYHVMGHTRVKRKWKMGNWPPVLTTEEEKAALQKEVADMIAAFAEGHRKGQWGSLNGTPVDHLIAQDLRGDSDNLLPRYRPLVVSHSLPGTTDSAARAEFTTTAYF